MVAGAVGSRDAGAVQHDGDAGLVQGNVHQQLVEGTVQERGVDGNHGVQAAEGHAGGGGQRVLLGNADVEHPFRVPGREFVQAHGNEHGAGNAHDVLAFIGDGGDLVGEDRRPGLGPAGFGGLSGFRVDDADGVELVSLMGARGRVAVALFGHGVHDDRTGVVLGSRECVLHGLEVVAVDGADVLHAEVFEHALRRPPVLDALLHGMQAPVGELAHGSAVLELPLPPVQGALVGRGRAEGIDGGAQGCEVVGKAAHGGGIGAAVVVDDDDHAAASCPRQCY